ncbi:hypothetical protein ACIPZF_03980 [Pseudomonas sp. NPDC089752]|uniref:hypothetical protein n=1 Tax=Pseudomonas sp. NPDC089752 TaxID=3364472 RepID=UPI0038303E5C
MYRLHVLLDRLFPYPSRRQALFAITAWPVLFAFGCWRTPQISEFLQSLGIEVTMWQVFHAALGAYILLLMNHGALNRRHFKRHAADIDRHRQLIKVGQGMVVAGLAGTSMNMVVIREEAKLRKRLGFLVEADRFYCSLESVILVFKWLCSKLR